MILKANDIKEFEKKHKIILPRDVGSETGVVATLLNHPEYILKTDFLHPRMFVERELGCIYHIIQHLNKEKVKSIDNFLIINEINGNKGFKAIFEDLENINNIAEFIEDLRLVARNSIEEYELLAKKVVTLSFKRETFIKLNEMSRTILTSEDDINAINYSLQNDIVKFADNYIVNGNIQVIGDKVDDLWSKIEEDRSSGFAGLPSKYPNLNKYFTYERTELVVIGGRAKSGKSMFFLNEAIHKVENGVPTAIFDTEMSDENWFIRFLALKSGVDIRRIKNGDTTEEENDKIRAAKDWLKDKPLIHIYDSDWTKDKIYMTAKQLKMSMGLDFLVFDYIKANDTSGMDGKEHNILGDYTNFLKNKIAGELDIPVMAGGQMSPKEMRLADSDKINRYASTVAYWIHKTREEKIADGIKQGNCKLVIDYNRNGMMFEEGEYLNFVFKGDVAAIDEAEVFEHMEDIPY